jgi:hypothetical protein
MEKVIAPIVSNYKDIMIKYSILYMGKSRNTMGDLPLQSASAEPGSGEPFAGHRAP